MGNEWSQLFPRSWPGFNTTGLPDSERRATLPLSGNKSSRCFLTIIADAIILDVATSVKSKNQVLAGYD